MSDVELERPDEDMEFAIDQEVYIVDANGYDIWEGTVTAVTEDHEYSIHYPEWPDDDEIVSKYRMLERTKRNKKIFVEQERIRNKKEKALGKEKKPLTRKEKPIPIKKEKPAKKPEKPKTEPKPKKAAFTYNSKYVQEFVLKAINTGISDVSDFSTYFDANINDSNYAQHKNMFIHTFQTNVQRMPPEPGSQDSYSGYSSDTEAEEQQKQQENLVEMLHIKRSIYNIQEGKLISLPTYVKFQDDEAAFSINQEDGKYNCFVYRTNSGDEYLILNGIKFQMRISNKSAEQQFLYNFTPVGRKMNNTSAFLVEQTVKITGQYNLVPTSDDVHKFGAAQTKGQQSSESRESTPSRSSGDSSNFYSMQKITQKYLEDDSD